MTAALTLLPGVASAGAVTEQARPALTQHPCVYPPSPPAAVWGPVKDVGTPPNLAPTNTHDVMTLVTNRGTVRIVLLTGAAPCTVNSFRFLASKKYFDKSHCHRLTTSGIYVLQCGDPFGTGDGGPGYMYPDENLVGATYKAGTVAMANAGPSTNGSQFFICWKDTQLDPLYTPFGYVYGNDLRIIKAVAAYGTDHGGDGHPLRSVVFKTITVKSG